MKPDHSELRAILKTLTAQERVVLELRNGIGCSRCFTLEEIAKVYKVTRQRVQQIQVKAMGKLQHPSRLKILAEMLHVELEDQ
jgi:RNA polymerase primary sigma factor